MIVLTSVHPGRPGHKHLIQMQREKVTSNTSQVAMLAPDCTNLHFKLDLQPHWHSRHCIGFIAAMSASVVQWIQTRPLQSVLIIIIIIITTTTITIITHASQG